MAARRFSVAVGAAVGCLGLASGAAPATAHQSVVVQPARFGSLPAGWREFTDPAAALIRQGASTETFATSWHYIPKLKWSGGELARRWHSRQRSPSAARARQSPTQSLSPNAASEHLSPGPEASVAAAPDDALLPRGRGQRPGISDTWKNRRGVQLRSPSQHQTAAANGSSPSRCSTRRQRDSLSAVGAAG